MEPIVLVHGYSAEGPGGSDREIAAIYGSLPGDLRRRYGPRRVVPIDLARWVSLEDGVTLDDVSRRLDRALREDHPRLLEGGFHAVVHSTGALVLRNWVRRFGGKPCALRNLVHLAGANFGSGWAHIGKGQLARWAHSVFPGGAEAGVRVLDALEFGSEWTLDLHLHFLGEGAGMEAHYGVRESVVVGSQADVSWYEVPIRYAKEDGSDGVVRCAAANLNVHYLRFGPTDEARALPWDEVAAEVGLHRERAAGARSLYEVKEQSQPGLGGRPEVPFAIPYGCAHSGEDAGIVSGAAPRRQVQRLLFAALEAGPGDREALRALYREETAKTYRAVRTRRAPAAWARWISEPRAQYDPHAMVVFRLRDQDGRPVRHFDVFFDSRAGAGEDSLAFRELFEDKHVNDASPHVIAFYLRTDAFEARRRGWAPRLPRVGGLALEITATEPETGEIVYLPLRFEFTRGQLEGWIRGHRTTVVDVELLRLPAPGVFRLTEA